jgi:hypothetical protein
MHVHVHVRDVPLRVRARPWGKHDQVLVRAVCDPFSKERSAQRADAALVHEHDAL